MRRLLALSAACPLLLVTAACGGGSSNASAGSSDSASTSASASASGGSSSAADGTIPGFAVSGDFGSAPVVKVKPAVSVTKPIVETVSAGTGAPVQANQKAMFDISIVKGDGSTVYSDATNGTPTQVSMSKDQFFSVLINGLVGKKRGSRVAIADSVKDVWGAQGAAQLKLKASDTVIFVVDVLSVQPTDVLSGPKGSSVKPPAGTPSVITKNGTVTGLDFSKAPKKPPSKLKVITLVKGDGPVVKSGRLVTFNYYGAVWGKSKPFDSSYSRGAPTPFGVGVHALIPAWDKVIPGLHEGSRVLIIAPPSEAYGSRSQSGIPANSTLTFVVDVLGVDS